MSRIGNKPVVVPSGVEIKITPANEISVKGAKGTLAQKVDRDIKVEVKDNTVIVSRPTEQKRHKALHGLYRALIQNMINGVTKGHGRKLELVGVGYKAEAKGNILELTLGYSHGIHFQVPQEISVKTMTEKGKNPTIILQGLDKQLIGQVAAKIRSLRPPEPYQGKGIRYSDEVIRKKAGKAAVKATTAA